MNVEQAIRDYIQGVIHMSLATASGGRPWICEVHFAYDEDLNLYFCSTAERRHSAEIAANPRVSGNIVEQHAQGDKPRCVSFEGTAEQLSDVGGDHPAHLAYFGRFGRDVRGEAKEEGGNRFFKIAVDTFYVFDARESKPATKYELPWSRA